MELITVIAVIELSWSPRFRVWSRVRTDIGAGELLTYGGVLSADDAYLLLEQTASIHTLILGSTLRGFQQLHHPIPYFAQPAILISFLVKGCVKFCITWRTCCLSESAAGPRSLSQEYLPSSSVQPKMTIA